MVQREPCYSRSLVFCRHLSPYRSTLSSFASEVAAADVRRPVIVSRLTFGGRLRFRRSALRSVFGTGQSMRTQFATLALSSIPVDVDQCIAEIDMQRPS